nr:unnamed protein product [Digitaria exilis]
MPPAFPSLPLPEAAAAAAHAALLALASLLLLLRAARALASRCASCLKPSPPPRRVVARAAADGGGGLAAAAASAWHRSVLACCAFALLLQVGTLSYEVAVAGSRVAAGALLLPAVQAVAWAALLALALQARALGWPRFPALVRVWWVVSFALCVGIAYDDSRRLIGDEATTADYAHMVANFASVPALGFLCLVGVMGSTGLELEFMDDMHEPLLLGRQLRDAEEEPGCLRVTPYGDAGILSLATLSWLSPLLSVGAQRPLELADIPLLAHKDRAKSCYKAMSAHYERQRLEHPDREPSLTWAILKSFWREAAVNGAFAAVNTIVSYVGPYLISYFVDYLSGNVAFPHEGYILASIFFVAKLLETLTARQWYLGVDIMGIHVKSGLTAMVYRKGLRLSNASRQSHTSGEIVNYMAVDVQRVGDYAWYFHDIWMLPLQIILALAILYKNVGFAMVSTLIATVLSIAASVPVAKLQEHYQDKLMASKDERMRKTSECLKNMRILKLQAWEDRYRLQLEEMRNVRISGTAAYVPQTAWIQSGNIEENILFGSPMDRQRYKRVIAACSLKKDLELLQYGDQTVIGDRGINLSGGQKQRVQLARALYQDADIYLLDDPFSAVDAHTGSELFKEYILSALATKTVIYVTHQVEFLPAADLILVLKDGHITQAGKYDDLLQAGTDFNALVSAHKEAIETMDIFEDSDADTVSSSIPDKRLTPSISNIDNLKNKMGENGQPSSARGIKEKKKDERKKKRTVQEEERERGRVSLNVYLSYMGEAYKDQSVVDLDIAFRLGGFASTTIQLLGIVAVMSKVTWQVLILIVPMAIACMWMQIRDLNLAAIEWLCLRMELLSTFVFAFCMAILVSFPPGTIEPSMAGLAVTYGLNLNARMSRWILSFCKLENRIISVERIYQYCKIPTEAPLIIENRRPSLSWPENGNIELIDLKVRYKDDLPLVLHGVSCMFPGGKKIGIVGRTGSGKSTLIQALFRLIEPTGGKIIIDNIDISTIGLHDLRSRLSIIPQDPTLFEGTIRMNLDPLEERADQEIWEALEKCQLGEVIRSKEEKLDSPVLENGDNWSVGQRQLIALGRALLKQAKILVLDEATASVDTATDNLIQKIIRSEFKDCTVCTIAHRIPTVIDSDLVLVLSDGKVAEFDTPQRLLEDKSSMFMQLVSEYSTRASCI